MLKPKKRVSRKEIKQDKLVTRFMMTETWILDNKKTLSYVGAGVVALILAGFVWSDRMATREAEATTRLAKILPVFEAGDVQQAIDGIAAQGTFGLRSIVEEYDGTDAGNMARIVYAKALLTQRKAADALSVLDDADGSTRMLQGAIHSGRGAALEMLGRHGEAARAYERSVSSDPDHPLASDRLFLAAANYRSAGNADQAVELIKNLKKQYPQSTYARDVERYLAQFSS